MRPAEVVRFDPALSAANAVPPVRDFAADAVVQIRIAAVRDAAGAVESAAVYRDGFYTLPSDQVSVGVSIHEGPRGANGPQVLLPGPFRTDRPVTYGPNPASPILFVNVNDRQAPLPGAPAHSAIRAVIANPGAYYVTFHSEAYPNGFLRGQLSDAAPANLPAVSDRGVINAAGATATAAAAPRGLTSLFGANLASATGVVPLTAAGELAEEFNGTEVTVGGMRAKLLFASPGQLNIQIPDVAPGTHPLQVKTPAGTSVATSLAVTATAPGIFVITKADYSLITAESPVAAGDPIILWTTGLGGSTPRLAPGLRAPADPLSIPNVTPEVLFAGKPGSVGCRGPRARVCGSRASGRHRRRWSWSGGGHAPVRRSHIQSHHHPPPLVTFWPKISARRQRRQTQLR
ncbi:MAG: CHRD domain-containing protein [Bryobacteraceae bacterium]